MNANPRLKGLPNPAATNIRHLLDGLRATPTTAVQRRWAKYYKTTVKELWITPDEEPRVEGVVKYRGVEWWLESTHQEMSQLARWIPFLRCLKEHRGVNLTFRLRRYDDDDDDDDMRTATLHKLFHDLTAPADTPASRKWDAYMYSCIKEQRIVPNARPHVGVIVKHAATEYWMGTQWGETPDSDWTRKTGFPCDVKWWPGGWDQHD